MIEYSKTAAGIVIRRLRKERAMSQEVFSRKAGVARSHLATIERGIKQVNFNTLWRIANAFNISPHILVYYIVYEAQKKENYD
jgi:transcriptional regulator with XRE-family HTH domain